MLLKVKNLRALVERYVNEDDDGMSFTHETYVEEDLTGRYVELNGQTYHSEDLPYPGTPVDVIDNSVGFYAENNITVEWADDTPAGTSRLTISGD